MVATAIVDTGCSKTILNQNFLSKNQRKCLNSPKMVTFEGKDHQCIGSEVVTLKVDGIKVPEEVILVDFRPFGVDMLLGMNTIRLLGGVSISPLHYGTRVYKFCTKVFVIIILFVYACKCHYINPILVFIRIFAKLDI